MPPTHQDPLAGFRRLRSVDAHAAGEPLRVVTEGWPEIPGDTMLRKRAHARAHHDALRRALMLEPRGHADMYGAVLTEPVTPDGDLGVLFLHNEGFSTMCGHGIVALTKVALDLGWYEGDTLRIDTPAGRVVATAIRRGGAVHQVRFRNVPSFVLAADQRIEVPGLGEVRYDLAFGGAFYAFVETGLDLGTRGVEALIRHGRAIKAAVASSARIAHPGGGDPDLDFLYGTIFVGPARAPSHSRHVCVFAEGEVDRSPTGTGVSGRAAILHARGVPCAEWITIESVLGTTFDVRVVDTLTVGGVPAVVPEVRGTAHITGRHEFLIDPDDPLRDGFVLR